MTHKQVTFTNRQSSKVDEMKQLVKQHIKKYKGKRFRSAFTTTQIVILEDEYKKNAYLNNTRREELSNKLHLSERTIKIWFQNRRMKEKRENIKIQIELKTEENETSGNKILKDGVNINLIKIKPLQLGCDVENLTIKRKIIIDPERKIINDTKQKNRHRNVEKEIKLCKTTTKDNFEKLKTTNNKIGKVIEFNSEVDFRNNKELENNTITENCSFKPNTESVIQNTKSHTEINTNTPNNSVTKEHRVIKTLPNKNIIKEETLEENTPVDLSKYYSVMANQNAPWDPYNLVPVIATGHPINRPYMLPNTNYASRSSTIFQPNTAPNRKCNCNCHNEDLMNFQPNLPFLYTNYLPHIFGVTNQNSSINK